MTIRTLLLGLSLTLLSSRYFFVRAQPPTPDPRFGLVQTYDDFAAATRLNTGFTRIKLYWDIIQPDGPNDWRPANVPDPLIEQDLAAGREVVGLIVRTPTWARNPTHPANDPDQPSAKDVPEMQAWGNFVRRLATQYQGRIQRWIIWNEPDVWDAAHPGSTWNGSVEDFAELQQVAYTNIKAVDPAMQVYLAGLTYWWDDNYDRPQYLTRLLDLLTAKPDAHRHNYYFDGVIYHLYYKPHQIYTVLAEIKDTLHRYNLGHKPIWLAETNAPPSTDPSEPPHGEPLFQVSLAEQAYFMLQVHALAFAAGAERVQIYKLFNSREHPEDIPPFGLLRGDKSPRPAFEAYKVVTTYLAGFTRVNAFFAGDVTTVVFEKPGETITVLWNEASTPRHVTLNAIADQGLLVEASGQTQPIRPERGQYVFDLPPASCSGGCFIGGPTYLLVEPGSPEQRQPLAVQATVTPTPTPRPSPVEILAVSPRRRMAFLGVNLVAFSVALVGLGWAWLKWGRE